MICYFIRHGQSQANADGVLAGQLDSPLTELGQLQAQREGERLLALGQTFDVIVASPLVRAYDTATTIAHALKYPLADIITDPRLMERHAGELAGQSSTLLADAIANNSMGIESTELLRARSQVALDDLAVRYPHQTVLIVAHAGVGRVMQAITGKTTDAVESGLSIPNAQAFRLL